MFQFERRKKLEVWLQFTGISRGNEHVHPLTLKKLKLKSIIATPGQSHGFVIQKVE